MNIREVLFVGVVFTIYGMLLQIMVASMLIKKGHIPKYLKKLGIGFIEPYKTIVPGPEKTAAQLKDEAKAKLDTNWKALKESWKNKKK